MKYKIKCKTQKEYEMIKSYFNDIGIDFKQKEGKSLKVDCNENELIIYIKNFLGIQPISIKPCKNKIVKCQIHNNYDEVKSDDNPSPYDHHIKHLDPFGLDEPYDIESEINRQLSETETKSSNPFLTNNYDDYDDSELY